MAKKPKAPLAPTTSIEEITGDQAVEIMATQEGKNRPLNRRKMLAIAEDILAGNYVLNGESIVFDEKGVLLDGQHRIAALLSAKEKGYDGTLMSIVVRGVPRAMFHTFDQGEKRTLKDVVAMDLHHELFADISVALRFLKIRMSGKKVSGAGKIPHAEAMQLLDEHKGLVPWVEYVCGVHKDTEYYPVKKMMSPGYLATICYLCECQYGEERLQDIEEFVKLMVNKDDDSKGKPAVALRKILIDNAMNANSKLKRDVLASFVVKALQMHMEGEECLKIKLKANENPKFDSEYVDEEPQGEE